MLKKLKSLIMAILLATIFPVLRVANAGAPGGSGGAGGGGAGVGKTRDRSEPSDQSEPSGTPAPTPEERIKALEGELAARDSRIQELERSGTEATASAGRLGESLKQAVDSYRQLIITAHPEILPELINGSTIEALEQSLAVGKELIGKIKTNLETQAQHTRIPAGAPPRSPEDLSGLSAREKIQRGIKG